MRAAIRISLLFFLIAISIFGGNVIAQSTFSKLFNLEIGADEHTRHTLSHEDTLYVFSKHSCWDGNDYSLCLSLTKFDLDGNQLSFHVIDDFWFPSKMDVLIDMDGNFVFAGHRTGPFLNRPIVILRTDHNLNIIESYEYEIEGSSSNGNFLIESATHYFVCGNRVTANNQNSYIQVLKVDKNNMEKIWLKDIFLDYHRNRGFGFSVNNDEDGISFLNYVESQNEQHYILAKFDMSGEVVSSTQLDRSLDILNLLSHSNGNLYFNTPNHPDDFLIRETLNVVNESSYESKWSKGFPRHYSRSFGGYTINDMIECKNGDVLICGSSSDIRDEDIEQGTGAGMLMRLNAEGVFKWVRYYKLPRAPEYEVDFNKNWVASLSDVYETESGGFIANGRAYYVKEDPAEELEFVFWLLSVDENGCIQGEECDELVQIDGEYGGFSSTLDPHNLWTEVDFTNSKPESYRYYLPFGAQLVQTFDQGLTYLTEIYQSNTMTEDDWSPTSSYLKNGTFFDPSLQEYFWRPDEIWFVDELRHKLLYDFALEVGDNFESDLLPDGVHLDVISKRDILMEDNSPRKVLKLRCSNDPTGELYGDRTWIQGMGDTKGLLSVKDCCRNERSTQLLCYSTSGVLRYEYEESEDCWTINTTSVASSPTNSEMHLSPNPAGDFVIVNFDNDSIVNELLLINPLGQIVKEFKIQMNQPISMNISNIQKGIYFVQVKSEEGKVFIEKLLIER